MWAAGRRWGRRERALLWGVLMAAWEAAWGQLRYSVPEEMPKGSFVGDVAKDLGLQLPAVRDGGARLVSAGRMRYFALHGQTGHLVTAERLDREQLCESAQQCVLRCELIVEGEMKVYGIEVEITDVNDNAPSFRKAETQLRMSETTAPGARFPLAEALDPDVGSNSLQRYELSGDEHFSLAVQAGPGEVERPELVLAKALDREEAAFHELVLRASDGGEPALTGTARIRVAVLDANDNAPVFSQAEYTARVPEDVPVGSTLVTVTAADADEGLNGHVMYTWQTVSLKASQILHLDAETGAITLVRSLDFEEGHSYELEVQARDAGELFDTAKIVITVTDVNDNAPEISVRSVLSAISEDAPSGTVVALLHVQDRDSGANGEVRCSIAERLPFRLEKSLEDYYRVVTAGQLDREEVSEYNVTVRAADGGSPALWSSAVLALRVLDVNDNAPVFAEARYSARLPENNAAGALVLTVRASDADWGQNARVRYRLWEGRVRGAPLSSYVSVQAETGALYALRSFDYEEVREVGLWVRAEDGGAPALSSNVSVRLVIVDENDNAPRVLYPPPASGAGWSGVELAPRSAEPGALVAKVVAVDADAGQNAWLSYELAKATEPGLFRVGLHSGEVRTARFPLARDAARQSLVVVVKDHGGRPALSATATLTVVLAESVAELLSELGSAAAAAPGEPAGSLTRWLVLAVAAVSCLFLAFLLLLLALRLRRWRRSQLLAAGSGALRGVPASHFVGIDGVRAFLRSYSHEVSLTADSRKSQLRSPGGSCCDTLPARPPPDEPAPLLGEDPAAAPDRRCISHASFKLLWKAGPSDNVSENVSRVNALTCHIHMNHSMVRVGRDLQRSTSPMPPPKQSSQHFHFSTITWCSLIQYLLNVFSSFLFISLDVSFQRTSEQTNVLSFFIQRCIFVKSLGDPVLAQHSEGQRTSCSLEAELMGAVGEGQLKDTRDMVSPCPIPSLPCYRAVTAVICHTHMVRTQAFFMVRRSCLCHFSLNGLYLQIRKMDDNMQGLIAGPHKMSLVVSDCADTLITATLEELHITCEIKNILCFFELVGAAKKPLCMHPRYDLCSQLRASCVCNISFNGVCLQSFASSLGLKLSLFVIDNPYKFLFYASLSHWNVVMRQVENEARDKKPSVSSEDGGEQMNISVVISSVIVSLYVFANYERLRSKATNCVGQQGLLRLPLPAKERPKLGAGSEPRRRARARGARPGAGCGGVAAPPGAAVGRREAEPEPQRSQRPAPAGGSLARRRPERQRPGQQRREAARDIAALRRDLRSSPRAAGRRRRESGPRRALPRMASRQRQSRRRAAGRALLPALLLCLCCRAAAERIRYAIAEELGRGSLVGPLARDLGLSPAELPARKLRLASAASRQLQYFTVSGESGNLYVSERLDREEMCGDSASCSVSFEALLHNPLNVFHVEVAIQDVNDNSPNFSKAALDLEINELTSPGARFPLEVARDADVGSNALLTYQLTSNPSFSLAVKESPGGKKQPELVLERALDREKQSSFELVLTAADGGDPVRSGTVQVRINVTDANDNAPVFSKSIYEARVRENVPAGWLVLRVRATDADAGSNGRVSYSFGNVPDGVRALFSVDSESGEVRTAGPLDFEEKSKYGFGMEARDGGGLAAHCEVQIDVSDENDNAPEITVLSLSSPVPEDAPAGTVVALLNVNDPDSGENGQVSCELSGEAPLSIVASSGGSYKVVTSSALDREQAAEHRVTVVARDRGSPALSSRTALVLEVSDVNDNAPVFEEAAYSAYVAENNAAGAPVLRVVARDADAGANGRVSYWLAGGSAGAADASPYVSVEARSGALYAQRPFDYEQCREFAVAVRAQDGGTPARSATATVRVFVLDRNDNAPRVLWPAAGSGAAASGAAPAAAPFEVVPRSAEAGYLVAKVVAVDADAGRNAWLSYELVQAAEPALFRVGLHSGEVRTARAVSERDAAKQRLVAVVKDHGQPALSATATLHVVLAESLQEALPELSERAAGAESPAELQFYLVLALALLSALFLLSVALAVLARVRRAGPPAVLRCLGAQRFSVAGAAFPADFCEGTLPYSYNLCVAPGRAVAEGAWPPPPLPSLAAEELLGGEPCGKRSPSGSAGAGEPPADPDAPLPEPASLFPCLSGGGVWLSSELVTVNAIKEGLVHGRIGRMWWTVLVVECSFVIVISPNLNLVNGWMQTRWLLLFPKGEFFAIFAVKADPFSVLDSKGACCAMNGKVTVSLCWVKEESFTHVFWRNGMSAALKHLISVIGGGVCHLKHVPYEVKVCVWLSRLVSQRLVFFPIRVAVIKARRLQEKNSWKRCAGEKASQEISAGREAMSAWICPVPASCGWVGQAGRAAPGSARCLQCREEAAGAAVDRGGAGGRPERCRQPRPLRPGSLAVWLLAAAGRSASVPAVRSRAAERRGRRHRPGAARWCRRSRRRWGAERWCGAGGAAAEMWAAGRRWGRRERALLWGVLVAAWEAAWGQLRYSVPEEMPKGSFVGDVAKDLGLQLPAVRDGGARLVSAGRTQHFSLHGQTGHLVTAERLDREQLCESAQQCVLRCELIVEGKMKFYEIEVEITDVNDNAPSFRKAETQLRMSETTAPGARFPLAEALDPDVGSNSLQRYELSGDEHFSLAVQAGPGGVERPELVLAKALDREEAAFHELLLRASDGGEPALTGTARIRVAVLDANDNAPVFSQAEYTARVPEDVPVGSTLVTVTAADADEGLNGHVMYTWQTVSLKASQILHLDAETGAITLVGSLDFEEGHSYELEVQARDAGELFDTAKIVITVTDVNDNAPEISVRSALSAISEDAPSGTVVALLHVQDRDSGANGEVRCSLDSGVPFQLRSSRGSYYRVVTAGQLDREEVSEYNVTVRAADGGSPALWSSAVLSLRVLDVNDNAPVFAEARYSARLPENNAAGALVLTVRASDADWGQNARVRYRLWEGRVRGAPLSSYVSVQAETGALYALRSFDYEEVREVGLWVRAEDGGAPALSSNVSVRLVIVDENDNAPRVLYPPPASGAGWSGVELAPRSAEPGALVAKVVAVDADAGQNAWLSYELAKATEPGLFRVGLHSGEVRTARFPLARDAARQSLVVVVKDHGRPALSATATLTVVLAESVAELLSELGSAAAAAPGEPAGSLTRWLVLAVAAVSCLFLAFLLLLLALRLRRWRRSQLLAAGSGALRGVPASHFVGIDGVRAFLRSYSHEVSLTADSRKSQLRSPGGSCCDTLPARPPPDEPAPLLGEDPAAAPVSSSGGTSCATLPSASPLPFPPVFCVLPREL
ncbi:LOW QUALITY PROTEIN: uncharacterized protein O9250_007979 [Rhynochetos jubatus]